MTNQQIADVINFIKSQHPHFTIEIIPQSMKGNFNVCFYHDIDNLNCSLSGIKNCLNLPTLEPSNMYKNHPLCIVIRDLSI